MRRMGRMPAVMLPLLLGLAAWVQAGTVELTASADRRPSLVTRLGRVVTEGLTEAMVGPCSPWRLHWHS